MPTYVAILRSVNVGSHNRIKMPALEACFESLGYTGVVTYIQSGNVVFKGRSKNETALAAAIHDRIARDLGCDVGVLLRSHDELVEVARANPFLKSGADASKVHVTFLAEQPAPALVRDVEAFDAGTDRIRVRGRDAYLHCAGGYGNTKLNGAFVEKRLKTVATTRNWNTVTKLVELSG